MRRGPLFNTRLRLAARAELRSRGYSFGEINDIVWAADDDVIDAAIEQAELDAPGVKAALGALGDGTIIQAIIDFLKSPAGQALLQALIALLLGML